MTNEFALICFSNAINLLSNVPVSCLDVLISPSSQEETDIKYNGMNMGAIQILLDFMEKRIDKVWAVKFLHKRGLFH